MKCHVKTLEGCARLLEIRAEEGEIKEAQEKVLQDFERVARIPGFRTGKAPRELVVQHYGKETREELLKRFIPELYDRALEESRLSPIGLPEITEVEFEDLKLSFKAKVETRPEVPLRKYKGLRASRKSVVVSPEEVQKNLRSIQEERSELVPKEGAVEEEDFVICDVEGRIDGKTVEDRKNMMISASTKDQKHPEVALALLGAKAGEVREAEVTSESPGGVIQKVHYQLRIHEVKKRNLPELNDEFVKTLGPFQTVGELEEAISKEIRRRKDEEAQKALERELLSELQKSCSFDVPRILVEEEAKRLVEEEHFRLRLLGWPDAEIEKRITQNKEKLLQDAEARVRNSLLLEKVAEIEKIQVSSEEINAKIGSLSDHLKRSGKEKEADLTNASLRRRVAGEIVFEKAIAILVTHAQIREAS